MIQNHEKFSNKTIKIILFLGFVLKTEVRRILKPGPLIYGLKCQNFAKISPGERPNSDNSYFDPVFDHNLIQLWF